MKDWNFTQTDPARIEDNLIRLIASDWMLVTAGTGDKFNTMTANWGGMGYLWNRNVVFVFVRPERFTFRFMEDSGGFTLAFFDDRYREALELCGTKSGRDCDKVAETGLTPLITPAGYTAFAEARMVIECRKMYADNLRSQAFTDSGPLRTHYGNNTGMHRLYIAEITGVWIR